MDTWKDKLDMKDNEKKTPPNLFLYICHTSELYVNK